MSIRGIALSALFILFGVLVNAQRPEEIVVEDQNSEELSNGRCPESAGMVSMGSFDGQSNVNSLPGPIFLCYLDQFEIINTGSDHDCVDPDPFSPTGIGYAFYQCPPSIQGFSAAAIASDPCVENMPPPSNGFFWTFRGERDGNATFINDGYIQDFFNGGNPEEMYFAPHTFDDFANRVVQETGGTAVVSTAEAFSVVYLNEIVIGNKQIGINGNPLEGSFEITGGLPEWDSSTYPDIGIFKIGNPSIRGMISGTSFTHGSTVTFTVPESGNYRIYAEDGVSCGGAMDALFEENVGNVTINISEISGVPGETVCVSFCVDNFIDVATMQFTIAFDPNILSYEDISNINLLGLTESGSFNITNASLGIINLTWVDLTTLGQTINNGECLFDLCFEIIGSAQPGDCSAVSITNSPTDIELTSSDNRTLVLSQNPGQICITPDTDLTVYVNTCNAQAGGFDGSLRFQVYGGTEPYSYEVLGAMVSDGGLLEGEEIFVGNLPAGPYTVRITDASGGPPSVRNIVIGSGSSLSVDLTGVDPTCFNLNNGSVQATVSGGTQLMSGGYNYAWSNLIYNTTSLNQLSQGYYTVTVTDGTGCTAEATEYIGKDPINISFTVDAIPTCETSNNGVVTAIATGGTPAANGFYTFEWSQPNSLIQTIDISQNTLVTAGLVNVRIIDDAGCQWNEAINLGFEKELEADIVYQRAIECADDDFAIVQVFGSYADGSPFLLGTASTAEPSGSFSQRGPDHLRDPMLLPGTYNITLVDRDNGCELDTTITIVQPEAIAINYTVDDDCTSPTNGEVSLLPEGGTPSYAFLWEDGSTADIRDDLPAGDYMVTVTDANGCTSDTTVNVTTSGSIFINAIIAENIGCSGNTSGSIEVQATGNGTLAFAWSGPGGPFGNTPTITNLGVGTYGFTITDALGCIAIDEVNITEAAAFPIVVSQALPFCAGQANGTLAASVPIAGTYTYAWDHPNNDNTEILDGIPAGSYGLTVTESGGCAKDTMVILDEPPTIDFQIVGALDSTSCFNTADGGATISASGGKLNNGLYGFLWSSGEGQPLNNNNTGTASMLEPGLQYVIGFDSECADTFYFDVPAPDSVVLDPILTTINNVSCYGLVDGSITIVGAGGTPGYEYQWPELSIDGPTISGLEAGYYLYAIIDANACLRVDSIQVTEPDSLVAEIDLMNTRNLGCSNDGNGAVFVTATGGDTDNPYIYQWSDDISTTNSATGLSAGIFSITVTDINGCIDSTSYQVIAPPPIVVDIPQPDEPVCFGDQTCISVLSVMGGSGSGYRFNVNSGPLLSIDSCLNVFAGQYDISVYDNTGCSYDTTLTIEDPEQLVLSLGPDLEIDLGDSTNVINVSIEGPNVITDIFWSPNEGFNCLSDDCNRVAIYPAQNTLYQVTVEDALGCEAYDELLVTVNRSVRVYFPNVFSPNNDGFNDIFNMYTGRGITAINEFRIFDRWGNQMYVNFNLMPNSGGTEGWDGRFNGKAVDSGVFTYYAIVTLIDNEEVMVRGDFTLLR